MHQSRASPKVRSQEQAALPMGVPFSGLPYSVPFLAGLSLSRWGMDQTSRARETKALHHGNAAVFNRAATFHSTSAGPTFPAWSNLS